MRPTNFFTRLTFFTCQSFFYLSNFFTRQKNVLKNFVKGLSKDRTTGSFSKTLPQTSPNYLKIVENISCHQNNYCRSIKTCFKKVWSNAKGGHAQEIFQKLPQTSPNFLKIVENISCHQNNYFQSIKTCFKIFWSNAKRGAQSTLGSAKGG